jgi:NAD-dependent DNA ligase
MSEELHRMFGRARLDDREVNELVGLAHGLVADGIVNDAEAKYLEKWLVAHADVRANPVVMNLLARVGTMLKEKSLGEEERQELFEALQKFAGGEFELGEILKATTLPLDRPEPDIVFANKVFCFTGTFAFGSRKDCELIVTQRGARCGALTQKTNYLVIGIYATGSWMHSSYGQKIERAVEMRNEGLPIHIIGEKHWRSCAGC